MSRKTAAIGLLVGSVAWSAVAGEPQTFRIRQFKHEPATRNVWMRWVKRDVQQLPYVQWVPERPRYNPRLYGLHVPSRLDFLIQYLTAVRVAAGRVPPEVMLTGAEQGPGCLLNPARQRCWFEETWLDTPLRKGT